MPYDRAPKRASRTLGVLVGLLAILALAPGVMAREAWNTKTVTTSTDTRACPGTLTVNVAWDKKGGPIASVEFHVYAWDAVNARWNHVSDATVTPSGRDMASYSFTGLADGAYTFTAFLWSSKTVTLGLYNGTAGTDAVTC